jgi:hypothetical protein
MYRTDWGRFTQADVIGYTGGNNLYAYTDNDPLNLTDPGGKCPWCIAGGIGAVVGGGVEIISNRNWTWTSLAIASGTGFIAGATGSGGVALVSKALSLAGVSGAGAAVVSEIAGSSLANAVGNATSQGIQVGLGIKQDFSSGELRLAFATGGAAAYARAGIAAAGGTELVASSLAANTAVDATVAGTGAAADLTSRYIQNGGSQATPFSIPTLGLYVNQNTPSK